MIAKTVHGDSPRPRKISHPGHRGWDIRLYLADKDDAGTFVVFLRVNDVLTESFSLGLRYQEKGIAPVVLLRVNGDHGEHPNPDGSKVRGPHLHAPTAEERLSPPPEDDWSTGPHTALSIGPEHHHLATAWNLLCSEARIAPNETMSKFMAEENGKLNQLAAEEALPMNAPEITHAMTAAFGASVEVRARRPGLYQVTLPAHLADRDAALVFVRLLPDARVHVSDVGHTCMRLSYTRKLEADTLEAIGRLARFHGLSLENGEIGVTVPSDEILAATLALVHVETAAEVSIKASVSRRISAERFKDTVREFLKRSFNGACTLDYSDAKHDPKGLWSIDALVRGKRADIGIAIVSGATEGERAIGTALHMEGAMRGRHFWVAVPRDINELPDLTRKRVMSEFLIPSPAFEDDREKVPDRIRTLGN
jgi:hypothetical protein